MGQCIFCSIADNTSKSHVVYEDDFCKAFLDHRPVRPGTVLLIPKLHINHAMDLPDDIASHMILVCNRIAKNMAAKLNPRPQRIGYVVSGYGVQHVHYILVPTYHPHDVTSQSYAGIKDGKVIFDETNLPLADPVVQEELAQLIRL